MRDVLDSARAVSEKSKQVFIDRQALARFAEVVATEAAPPEWDQACHFHDGGEATAAYILVLDAVNFCFWPMPGKPRWEIDYRGEKLSGYVALAAALKRAVEAGVPVTDARFLANLTPEDMRDVLGGAGELLLMEARTANLNELGSLLLNRYEGKAGKLVEAAGASAVELVRLVAGQLTSFQDVASYQGDAVYFYKRAQILAADLHGSFKGAGLGRFEDMDRLTAFADYKLPQVLRHLGILRYGPDLAGRVDRKVLLEPGSPEEVEIRANTIRAVDLLRQTVVAGGKDLKAYEIDWVLWNLGQKDAYRLKPYHRSVTIFY